MKKAYTAPKFSVYGSVQQITLAADQTNADVPNGNTNNAFPLVSA